MKIVVVKETDPGEKRVAAIPETVRKLTEAGAEVAVETGLGATIDVTDGAYREAGAVLSADRAELLGAADIVLRVRQPAAADLAALRAETIHISFIDPFLETELLQQMAAAGLSTISMEMIPRTTLAQKMDALSSQASLAGYTTVMLAASRLKKVLPMMMTPAGTIAPSRVFVIGAGVAGLQAIATAKRLGARVEAFDVRPEAAEQIQSLGAKAVKIDVGETSSTKDGYAKQLTPEQLELQRQGMAKICAASDIVITTAKVFGRKAPVIVTADMVAGMKPGSVIVDMAVEAGGNVEGAVLDQEVDVNGVIIIGLGDLPSRTAYHASQMYASNLCNLISTWWDKEAKRFVLDREDEIIQGCLITHGGEIVNERIKAHLAK